MIHGVKLSFNGCFCTWGTWFLQPGFFSSWKWNKMKLNHRKWSGLFGESNIYLLFHKRLNPFNSLLYLFFFFKSLPLSLITIDFSFLFLFFFSFVSSNLVFQQWSVMERTQALKADKPRVESRICLSLVVWPEVRHSLWAWAYSL